MGGNLLHQFANETSAYPANATVLFNEQYTGFGLADYLLGYASGFRQGAGETQNETGLELGIYAQDAWRVQPNLTLTAGVSLTCPRPFANGRGADFIPGQKSTRYPSAPLNLVFPGDAGVASSLFPHDYSLVGPRIGIAYQPKLLPNTAFHAAFGMFFAPFAYSSYNHTADVAPFSPTYSFSGTASTPIRSQTPTPAPIPGPTASTRFRRSLRPVRSLFYGNVPARRRQHRSRVPTRFQAWHHSELERFGRLAIR